MGMGTGQQAADLTEKLSRSGKSKLERAVPRGCREERQAVKMEPFDE